jgi:hypothetical protein
MGSILRQPTMSLSINLINGSHILWQWKVVGVKPKADLTRDKSLQGFVLCSPLEPERTGPLVGT